MTKLLKSTKKFEKKRHHKGHFLRKNIKKRKNKNEMIKKRNLQNKRKDFNEKNIYSSLNGTLNTSQEFILSKNEDQETLSLSSLELNHKMQLETLKNEDPKFYKYLEEEEADLLEFEDSDISNDINIEDKDISQDINEKTITLNTIHEWKEILIKKSSLKILKKAVMTLHTVSQFDEKTSSIKNSITIDSNVFNALITLVFKQIPRILNNYFPLKRITIENKHSQEKKNIKKILFILKIQFSNILRLLHNLTDPDILHMMLKEVEKLIPYALIYRNTQSQNIVRNDAYTLIEKILLIGDKNYIEQGLKSIYVTLIQQSSHTNAITLPFIHSMKDAALKLFGIDQTISYQISFKCIRQLSIYLRNAIIKHDKVICNWKYIHSIDFLSRILSNYCNKTKKSTQPFPMQDLIYPLVQMTLGTIKLISSSQFFPLKFHLIRNLIHISYHTGVYIPLASYIFEILESKEIKNKPAPSTAKPIDFELCIRVPKSYLKGKIYQDGLIEQIVELLLEIYLLQCKSISFPELSMPMIIQIKRYIKQSKNPKLNKSLTIFIKKLEENSKFIESQRESIEFSPDKINEMDTFLENYEWDKTPLGKYISLQKRIKKERKRIETEQQKQNTDQTSSDFSNDSMNDLEDDFENDSD
ncbi:hypothetical protein PCANB_002152 [Pneumocystis canis]|nr:hypothetical protein PCANB_002152 [Pneumocystis canis]